MVKIKELYDRITGKKFYPITSSEAVFCKNGENLERRLVTDKEEIEAQMSNIVSEPTDKALEALEPAIVRDALRKNQQALTEAERKQVRINLGLGAYDATGAWVPQAFIDRWNARAGEYGCFNYQSRYFELNGIFDIDYVEAQRIDGLSWWTNVCFTITRGIISRDLKVRTVMPFYHKHGGDSIEFFQFAAGNTSLETVRFIGGVGHINGVLSFTSAFSYCYRLRYIYGEIKLNNSTTGAENAFTACESLIGIEISHLQKNINFRWSRNLSLESFQYMVANAANTSAITITVHPDVYAKLTDETNTEWYQVLLDAAEKDITFATV